METLDKALSLVFQMMWASSLDVSEVSCLSGFTHISRSFSVFIRDGIVCTFSDSHLVFLCSWVFQGSWMQSSAVSDARQVLSSSFFRRSFDFASWAPVQAPHSRDRKSPSVVRFPNQRIQSVRLPLYSVVFSDFNWIWDLSPRAPPLALVSKIVGQYRLMSRAPMVARR